MPMIDIQRRHAEVFRIRLGDSNGGRPRKLTDQIRITARSQQIVSAFTDVYGGEVKPWDSQWQAYLPTTELRILVLPGQSVQQWWELYRGSVCERRCDGFQEQKSGERCKCPEDVTERLKDPKACSPMTRVNVLCPDVAVVGAGGLVTHGMIAAETLPQSIAVAESALRRGFMVPAMLRVVANSHGRHHFIYPQIEIFGTSLNELTDAEFGDLPHAALTPLRELEERPALLAPVPASVTERPVASIADQVAAAAEPPPPKPRANAAQPIPPTGLEPRTAAEAGAVVIEDDNEPTMATPEEQAWIDLAALLNEAPSATDTKPVLEGRLRNLYSLMEFVSLWPRASDGTDALHMALHKHHQAAHVGDLNKEPLLDFCKKSWEAARTATSKA